MTAAVMALCLQTIGEAVVLSPTSPVNLNGAIDASEEPVGPLFLTDPEPIGQGHLTANALAETGTETLAAVPRPETRLDLDVRTTLVVVAASYGLTDRLDASLVLPVMQEDVDARVRIGPLAGHAAFAQAGVSDLSLRLKYQLLPSLALTLKAIFPTGKSNLGFGLGSYWLTPGVAVALPLGARTRLTAQVAGELDVAHVQGSGLSYGVGAATRLGPVALVVEFLGSTGIQNALSLFDVTYGDGHTFDLAFGLRAPLPLGFMVFVAGTYALDHDGIRPAGVSPVLGVGWHGLP